MRRSRQFRGVVATGTVLALLGGGGVAFADGVVSDGDGVAAPFNNQDWAVGEVCVGSSDTRAIPVAARRNGTANDNKTNNVFANSSSVALSGASSDLVFESGSKTVTLPSGWQVLDTGSLSDSVSFNVTYTAPSTTGSFSRTATFSIAGKNNAGGNVTATDTLTVSGTAKTCTVADATLPANAAVSINGGADWTNNTAASLAVSATDNVGITRYRVASTQGGLADATDVAVSPAATSFSAPSVAHTLATGDGSKTVWVRVFDAANNSADASDTIGLDTAVPVITPTVTVPNGTYTPGAGRWTNQSVTVGFNCSDGTSGSGVASSTVAGTTLNNSGANQSVTNTGACTDNAGNSAAAASVGAINIDKNRPVITPTVTVPNGTYTPGVGSWTNQSVTVDFSCADETGGSGVASSTVAGTTLSNSGANQSVTNTGACSDNAGNSAAAASVGAINIDKNRPVITPTVTVPNGTYTPGVGSWTNQSVTVDFSCADETGGSGVASSTVAGTTLSSDGAGQSVTNTGACTDNATNPAATSTVSDINVDKTAPTSVVSGVTDGAVYLSAPTVTCTATDQVGLSGVLSHGTPSGNSTTAGVKTVTCNGATDNAGNTQTTASNSVTYTLAPIGSFNANFDGNAVLKVKTNQAIPLKWAFNDGTRNHALLSTASMSSVSSTRCSTVAGTDGTESATEVAAGASGLQLLPDNSYQMNWKAGTTTGCRALSVKMTASSGSEITRTILVDIVK